MDRRRKDRTHPRKPHCRRCRVDGGGESPKLEIRKKIITGNSLAAFDFCFLKWYTSPR